MAVRGRQRRTQRPPRSEPRHYAASCGRSLSSPCRTIAFQRRRKSAIHGVYHDESTALSRRATRLAASPTAASDGAAAPSTAEPSATTTKACTATEAAGAAKTSGPAHAKPACIDVRRIRRHWLVEIGEHDPLPLDETRRDLRTVRTNSADIDAHR